MKNILPITLTATLVLASMVFAQPFYTEDFANGTLHHTWYPGYSGNTMEVEFQTGNPSGDGWVGKLGNDLSGGGVGQTFSGDPTWTDFYYEAQVYIPVNEGTYYGIEFRIDSVGNSSGYQFVARFNPSGGATKMRFRMRPGTGFPTAIRDWDASEVPGGIPTTSGWHKLAVKAVGNQFWFYYDDQEMPGCPYTDNTFASGWIGAYIWDFVLSPIYLYIDDIVVTDAITDIKPTDSPLISDFALQQNYPNPFNPTTNIAFDLPVSATVQMNIYNSLGQKVRSLVNAFFPAGHHQVQWNALDDAGRSVPAGIYYYQLRTNAFQATHKMMLLK